MIDTRILRETPERVRANLESRNIVDFPFEELLSLERQRRELITTNQKLKEERNRISLDISKVKKEGNDAADLIAEMKKTSDEIVDIDKRTQNVAERFQTIVATLPNFVDAEVPIGKDETANKEIMRWGEPRQGRLDHIDIADRFDLIDIERAAKTSGARFYFLKRDLARMNYALISLRVGLS